MGIQDRDYDAEKHKATANSNVRDLEGKHNQKTPQKSTGGLRYLLIPTLMLLALWYGADVLLKNMAHSKYSGLSATVKPISGGIEMQADRQGHFRGMALINNVAMPFMIDTGATLTAIPANLASAADLPFGRPVTANTAGGKAVDRLTNINSLKIGNAEIKNLDASINEHLDEVLIGMNTLKYFNMTQRGNIMTLIANDLKPQQTGQAPNVSQTVPQPTEQAILK